MNPHFEYTFAYVWRDGSIGFGRKVPAKALEVAHDLKGSHMLKHVVLGFAKQFGGEGPFFLPCVSEEKDYEKAYENLVKFSQIAQEKIDSSSRGEWDLTDMKKKMEESGLLIYNKKKEGRVMRSETFNWTADLAFSQMFNNPNFVMEYVNPFGNVTKIKWNGKSFIRYDFGWEETAFTSYMANTFFRVSECECDEG